MQVEKDDKLPNTICNSCDSNLKLLSIFRNVCLQSDESSKLKLDECFDIKPTEILLDDLIWDDEPGASSQLNFCKHEIHEEKSSALEQSDQKSPLIKIASSPVK